MIIPHRELSPDALSAVIEEFVTRDGTELTDAQVKGAEIRRALERGGLVLVFDPDSETCSFVPPDELPTDD